MIDSSSAPTFVFVGTYTKASSRSRARSEGIYVFQMDTLTGRLTPAHTIPGITNPSFLTLDPSRRHLYAVSEVQRSESSLGGSVNAYDVERTSGLLTALDQQSTHGDDPCHLTVDRTGRYVIAANYTSGSVAMFPILDDGQVGPSSDFVQHIGSSVDPEHKQVPHAHSVTIDPANRYALIADLGLDQVLVYQLDLEHGKLILNEPASLTLAPGSGPRHVAFHPNGQYVFVINEIASTLTACSYETASGTLRELQTVSTLPADFTGRNSCADVHVHPSGRFVYGSNRGHDSIVIFAIEPETGSLSYVAHQPSGGSTPRNFALDPTGTYLFAANQNSDSIVPFAIDPTTGRLTPTNHIVKVPSPVCVQIVPMGSDAG